VHPDTCNNVVFVPPSFLKASETRRVAADLEASVREKAVVKVKGLFCEDGGYALLSQPAFVQHI
jgi:hypothetical protein